MKERKLAVNYPLTMLRKNIYIFYEKKREFN